MRCRSATFSSQAREFSLTQAPAGRTTAAARAKDTRSGTSCQNLRTIHVGPRGEGIGRNGLRFWFFRHDGHVGTCGWRGRIIDSCGQRRGNGGRLFSSFFRRGFVCCRARRNAREYVIQGKNHLDSFLNDVLLSTMDSRTFAKLGALCRGDGSVQPRVNPRSVQNSGIAKKSSIL